MITMLNKVGDRIQIYIPAVDLYTSGIVEALALGEFALVSVRGSISGHSIEFVKWNSETAEWEHIAKEPVTINASSH